MPRETAYLLYITSGSAFYEMDKRRIVFGLCSSCNFKNEHLDDVQDWGFDRSRDHQATEGAAFLPATIPSAISAVTSWSRSKHMSVRMSLSCGVKALAPGTSSPDS